MSECSKAGSQRLLVGEQAMNSSEVNQATTILVRPPKAGLDDSGKCKKCVDLSPVMELDSFIEDDENLISKTRYVMLCGDNLCEKLLNLENQGATIVFIQEEVPSSIKSRQFQQIHWHSSGDTEKCRKQAEIFFSLLNELKESEIHTTLNSKGHEALVKEAAKVHHYHLKASSGQTLIFHKKKREPQSPGPLAPLAGVPVGDYLIRF